MNKDALVVGLALFAMFFGAGNLIFPPFLGMESGWEWPLGLACFVFVDVVISCIGIVAINRAGGSILSIEGVLGKRAALVLNTAAILCTGVIIASPRTAATTYEMSIAPLLGDWIGLLPFSLLFFAVVLLFTLRPTRIVDIVGKVLTPVLVAGIVIMVVAGVVSPLGPVVAPESATVVADGISAGYQTMDILAVVGFAIIVQESVRAAGYADAKSQLSVTARASLVACVLLTLVYGGLTYLGATAATVVSHDVNQATLITLITEQLMGRAGLIVLGVVVGFACLTTAVGLCGATAAYIERITGRRVGYRTALIAVVVIALLICNLGLTNIINLAAPVLSVICPPFMITVVLLLFRKRIRSTWTFKGAALMATAASLLLTLHDVTGAFAFVQAAPLYSYGFSWLIPAVVGAAGGALLGRRFDQNLLQAHN
ncbi:branched-chain amino acid transport system II carrier protein [Adlercreutzia sp. R7]|uniref:Branched-chain amino acid transport system II carrier protein n=1 Tax=Adlercreutzia wanghongyangiae TaxID=3111451 RepID=A0ABU6IHF7_9ACTN|nr:branched-chain amino acid transport system II carrier protein [Adlercreutzia sp. R7]